MQASNAPKRPRDSNGDQRQQQRSASAPSNDAGASSPEEQGQKKRKVAEVPASGVKKKRVTWPTDDKIANIRHFTKADKEDTKIVSAVGLVSLYPIHSHPFVCLHDIDLH